MAGLEVSRPILGNPVFLIIPKNPVIRYVSCSVLNDERNNELIVKVIVIFHVNKSRPWQKSFELCFGQQRITIFFIFTSNWNMLLGLF
jgi:hypothetical protein